MLTITNSKACEGRTHEHNSGKQRDSVYVELFSYETRGGGNEKLELLHLEHGVVIHQDGHHANIGKEPGTIIQIIINQ